MSLVLCLLTRVKAVRKEFSGSERDLEESESEKGTGTD